MTRRVLLIDADATFRDTLTHQLARYGVAVVTEPDGDNAIGAATADPPVAVVIAIEDADKTTGFRTFQKCKKSLAGVPIVLVTSSVAPEELAKHKKLKSHADEYLDKRTLTTDDMIAKLDHLIGLGEVQEDALDIPVEDDIPMELADGDVVLDETVGEEQEAASQEFVHEALTIGPSKGVPIDRVVEAETDAAFDALLGDDEPVARSAEPAPAHEPEPPPAPELAEAIEASAVPEPVPDPSDDEAELAAVVPVEDPDSAAVPEPVPDPGSDPLEEEEPSGTLLVPDDDLVPMEDEPAVETPDALELAPEPAAPEPEPVASAPKPAEPVRPSKLEEALPPLEPPPVQSRRITGTHPPIDLGLDVVAQDADREQSGAYDRRSLRKIHDLEREISQLKQDLDRSRAAADAAAKGAGREAQFLKLREQLDARDREAKQAKDTIGTRDGEIADVRKRLEQLAHAKAQLETKNKDLEQRIFDSGDRTKEIEADAQAAAAQVAALKAELEASQHELEASQHELEGSQRALADATEASRRAVADATHTSQRAVAEATQAGQRALADASEANRRAVASATDAGEQALADAVAASQQALKAADERHREDVAKLHAELDAANARAREQALDELNRSKGKELETALADSDRKHGKEIVRLKAELAKELSQLSEELGGEIHQLKQILEAKESELQAARKTHVDALETANADHARRLAAAAAEHEQELAAAAATHQSELEAVAEEHTEARGREAETQARAVAQLKLEHDQATAASDIKLATARREREQMIAQHEEHKALLHDQHRDELAQLKEAHEQQLAAVERERARIEGEAKHAANSHRAAIADARRQHEAALAEAQELAQREAAELRAEIATTKQGAEEQAERHASEREALTHDREREVAELGAKHERTVAELGAKHERTVAELATKHERALAVANGDFIKQKALADADHAQALAASKAETEKVTAELTAENTELQRGLSSTRESLKRTETELAAALQTVAQRNAELRQHAAGILERDQRIAELRKEIEALEQENTGYQDQVLRAYQKIKNDEAMVAKARKAMAIALTVLDDEPVSS
jgi:hypothetical protein